MLGFFTSYVQIIIDKLNAKLINAADGLQMCYMSLCCRSFHSSVTTIIESCMSRGTGLPDIETFAALGLHHLEEVRI